MTIAKGSLPFDVYGFFGLPQGLRYAADATLEGLAEQGAPVRLHTISGRLAEAAIEPESALGDPGVNLFHVNPDQLRSVFGSRHSDPRFEAQFNAIVPFWEVTSIPIGWRGVLESMDVIVAPTVFVGDVLRQAALGVPVIDHHVVVDVPTADPARARFGLPADAIVFGFAFGSEAVVERKNPVGVIEAFRAAFPGDPDVRLAIRLNPTGESSVRVVDELRKASAGDPRVVFIQGPLGYREVLSFYASLDAYVSLHRAEGLGLGIMESMAVGTPVIATAWSGNMGFTTPETSLLVQYDLVPVPESPSSPYRSALLECQAFWAEPRLKDAVAAMRRIREQPDVRATLSAAAATEYRRTLARARAANLVDAVGALVRMEGPDATAHAFRAGRLRAIEHEAAESRSLLSRVRRRAVRAIRGERL